MTVSRILITGFFLIFSVACLFPVQAQSQEAPQVRNGAAVQVAQLSGRVVDEANHLPLSGASIYFTDLKTGAITDTAGYFIIRNIPQGKHLVEVSYVGFATINEWVVLAGASHHDFVLKTSILENNEVIVTGVSAATAMRRMPAPVSLIRKQELSKITATNLVDLIAHKPGIAQVSTGPAISKPVIRGLGFNRVVVLNDGVKQEGQQWGDEHGLELDEYSVQKVEILKGPASLIYGSDAMAGVVQVFTNMPVPQGTIRGNFTSQYQTNNRMRGWGGQLGGYGQHGFNWNVYVSGKAAGDYSNKYDGRVYNSKFNEFNTGGYFGVNRKWGYSHIIFSQFGQKIGIVEGERDDDGNFIKPLPGGGDALPSATDFNTVTPQIPWQHIRHTRLVSDNSFNLGTGRLAVIAGYQRNQRMEYGNIDVPDERNLYFDLNTFTYNITYHFKGNSNWNTAAGISGMQQQNRNKGLEVLIPEYSLFDAGAFLFTSRNFEKWTISGGIRYDQRHLRSDRYEENNQVKFQSFTRSFFNVSASAGLSYIPSKDWVLKLNFSRGFRAPTIAELASNGAHEGTNRYEYGQQELKSESSFQTDLGLEWSSEHLSLTASFFYNSIRNFIFYRKLDAAAGGDSMVLVDGDLIQAFRFDQRNAALYGFELTADLHPHPLDWLHFENSFSFVRGIFNTPIEGNRNIPFIPAARLVSNLRAEIPSRLKWIKGTYLSFELDHRFAQNNAFTAYETETATPAYTLLNAGAGMEFVKGSKTLFSLYVNALNLADVAYQDHLNRLKYTMENKATGRMGVFNMGRNFSIRVNVPVAALLKAKAN